MQWKSLQALTPGLTHLLGYQRSWLKPDIRAGLSVAAVALPVAIAYAELAGGQPGGGGSIPVSCRWWPMRCLARRAS